MKGFCLSQSSEGMSAKAGEGNNWLLDGVGEAYQAVCYDVVLLEHWSGHLGVLVVVVLDEVFIAHAGLLLD